MGKSSEIRSLIKAAIRDQSRTGDAAAMTGANSRTRWEQSQAYKRKADELRKAGDPYLATAFDKFAAEKGKGLIDPELGTLAAATTAAGGAGFVVADQLTRKRKK